jgi:hypothetical protein
MNVRRFFKALPHPRDSSGLEEALRSMVAISTCGDPPPWGYARHLDFGPETCSADDDVLGRADARTRTGDPF